MTAPLDVIAISRSRDTAVLSDGNQARVTLWLDRDGDECSGLDAVVAIVMASSDLWIVVDLSDYDATTFH